MTRGNESLEAPCSKIMEIPGIRFVGVIDRMGRRVAGGFKEGITSYLPDRENRRMYVQLALEYLMRKDFDEALGPIEYIASRRGKVTMLSIPAGDRIVLISAEHGADIEEITTSVNSTFTSLFGVRA